MFIWKTTLKSQEPHFVESKHTKENIIQKKRNFHLIAKGVEKAKGWHHININRKGNFQNGKANQKLIKKLKLIMKISKKSRKESHQLLFE